MLKYEYIIAPIMDPTIPLKSKKIMNSKRFISEMISPGDKTSSGMELKPGPQLLFD